MSDYFLSPSSLNLFIEEPSLWVLKEFFHVRSSINIWAARGRLIESMLNYRIDKGEDMSFPEFVEQFTDETFFICSSDHGHDLVENVYDWGLLASRAFFHLYDVKTLEKTQFLATTDKYGLPVGGYIDYLFKDVAVDLKTVNKLPTVVTRGARKGLLSKSKVSNIRQQVIYSAATNRPAELLYIDPTGDYLCHRVSQDEVDEVEASILKAVKTITKLLKMSQTSVIREVKPKNMNSIYWDKVTREFAESIWGKQDIKP